MQQFNSKLVSQATALINNSNEIEQLLLIISLEKLQQNSLSIIEPSDESKAKYPFFVAGILGEVSAIRN